MSIKIENLKHIYNEGMPYETVALDNVNIEIYETEFIAVIGHTGSGKSTLVQHLNGLLKPKSGRIWINGFDITDKKVKMSEVRQKVGLVFQYPEYQLFEETVYKDIAFGPTNLGISEDEIKERVYEAINQVGLDYEAVKDKSPFELSGGQKRRVAIAGVIAMKPEVLILDEPTAGLDPKGRAETMEMLKALHTQEKNTIILVSHNMGDVAQYADKIIVMEKGSVVLNGKPKEIYKHIELLEKIGLGVPPVMKLMHQLKKNGKDVDVNIYTLEEAEQQIIELIRSK
ncbi:MAG: energy-coupling factor transporter ATPase [Clostridia bacterium]|nr:energy-coupling factor transporter ATPase [Clostridia bacterium]